MCSDYAEDLLGVLALESVRGGFIVIGEDLGTVTGRSARRSWPKRASWDIALLWFEKNPDGSFRPPRANIRRTRPSRPPRTICRRSRDSSQGRDIEAAQAAGLIDEAAYRRAVGSARKTRSARLDEALQQAGFRGRSLGICAGDAVRAGDRQSGRSDRARPSSRTCRAAPGSIPTGGGR